MILVAILRLFKKKRPEHLSAHPSFVSNVLVSSSSTHSLPTMPLFGSGNSTHPARPLSMSTECSKNSVTQLPTTNINLNDNEDEDGLKGLLRKNKYPTWKDHLTHNLSPREEALKREYMRSVSMDEGPVMIKENQSAGSPRFRKSGGPKRLAGGSPKPSDKRKEAIHLHKDRTKTFGSNPM